MEVGRGKRYRCAGVVGRDRGVFGVSRADVPFPGAGRRGGEGSVHGLPRGRDGGDGAWHRGQAHIVRLASVDYGAARAARVERRAIADRRPPSSLMPTAAAGPEIERLIALLARLPGLGPRSARRAPAIIVAVADVADLWALERAHAINARYHVLGGTLSPLDGIGPQDLSIDA